MKVSHIASILAGVATISYLLTTPDLPAQLAAAETTDPKDLQAVGVATVDITPEHPIRLSGYGSRSTPSAGVEQKLYAKALCFDRESLLITVDTIGIPAWVTGEVGQQLEKLTGVKRAQFVICSTHSHTAPTLHGTLPFMFPSGLTAEEKIVITKYTESLINSLVAVGRMAYNNSQPAQIQWGKGKLTFAANRRVLENGKWKGFGVQKNGPVDHSLPMMKITSSKGELLAVLANYACHCTTLGGNFNRVHGDWAGVAQEEIEERHPGTTALIAIGCGADQNPEPRGELDMAISHGKALADEVDRLLQTKLSPLTKPPKGIYREITLSLEDPPERSTWEEQVEKKSRGHHFAKAMLEKLDREEKLESEVTYPIQTWTFGEELAMVFLAGEVVVDFAHRFYREFDADRLWINAYSNDVPCYIPSYRIHAEGGYEVDYSMVYYGKPARLTFDTENRICEEVARQLPPHFAVAGNGRVIPTTHGAIHLAARKGLGKGPVTRFEKSKALWDDLTSEGSITWTVSNLPAGDYLVLFEAGLDAPEIADLDQFQLEVGRELVSGKVRKTGNLNQLKKSKFGTIRIPESKRNARIRFRHSLPNGRISVREIVLLPLRE